ncbi:hypothetical protein K0U27_11270 [archaeon]|nr:hypothetical protein [archaeon]
MKKQQFLKITKFSAIGIGLVYLILLYVIALAGRDNFFMGMLLSLPAMMGFIAIFSAASAFAFYLISTNRVSGYFLLPAILFVQTVLFGDTWLMHWPCPKCPYLQ